MRDLMNNVHPVKAISPAAAVTNNTAIVSDWIDRLAGSSAPFDSLTFLILAGGLADADATFTVLVEDASAADKSDAAAVPDAGLIGTEVLASFQFDDDNEPRKIGYMNNKRFVRLSITPAGNTGDAFVAAIALLGHPANAPTPNPPI